MLYLSVFMFQLLIIFSRACSIADPDMDTVIITGGYVGRKVSVYEESGWIKDLSDLRVVRRRHACTSYVHNAKRVTFQISKLMLIKKGKSLLLTVLPCNRWHD